LYDINPGEGFNLRRDVYMRMANLMSKLRERTSLESNWTLVLPPWGPLYHWFSYELPRTKLPWSLFFDLTSLSRFVPVMEFDEFLRLSSSTSTSRSTISHVFTLQHFREGWGEHFQEKLELRPCIDKPIYEQRADRYYYGWFFDYSDRLRAEHFRCLSAQGFATVLVDFIRQNITWPLTTSGEHIVKSVMFDRAETLLHSEFGSESYWRARRSMRYATSLINFGKNRSQLSVHEPMFMLLFALSGNLFRAHHLNSTDKLDRTVLIDDWTKMKRHHGQALGGPYLAIHLRRRDYVTARAAHVPSLEHAARQACRFLDRLNLSRLFIASDADDNELEQFRQHTHSICRVSLHDIHVYRPDEKTRKTLLDGGKAIVDQWICAHARYFVGSYESTFTFRIQEDREILGFESHSTFDRLCGDNEGFTCDKSTVWPIVY
jgi:peptide-O-fucosyltransferase